MATRNINDVVTADDEVPKYRHATKSTGDYDSAKTYLQGDEVSDGSNVSECLVDNVTSKPFVEPSGAPFAIYDGTITNTPQSASQIIFGNRYGPNTNAYYINSYRVNVVAENQYRVYTVLDPLGEALLREQLSFTVDTTGWINFSTNAEVVPSGTVFDLLVQVSEPDPTPTTTVLSYNYTTPQNDGVPATGGILHSNKSASIMNIHHIDDDGADNSVFLRALSIGDQISDGTVDWAVQSNTDNGTYSTIGVAPAANSTADTKDFTFETVTATPISIPNETDYWLTSPHTAQGVIAIDVPYGSATINDNAYGVDITTQLAYVPDETEWHLKVIGNAPSSPTVRASDINSVIASANIAYTGSFTVGHGVNQKTLTFNRGLLISVI